MDAWIVILIVVAALTTFGIVQYFGGGRWSRRSLAEAAQDRARDVREAAEAAMAVELEALEEDRTALEEIKAIEAEGERLQALADFANRRRKR